MKNATIVQIIRPGVTWMRALLASISSATSHQDVRQESADEAVEHDGLGQREAEPLDALELTAELGLAGDALDHRAEDVPDADARAERAEADTEGERDRLAGFGHVARRGGDDGVAHWFLPLFLVFRLDRRADVDG